MATTRILRDDYTVTVIGTSVPQIDKVNFVKIIKLSKINKFLMFLFIVGQFKFHATHVKIK